MKRLPSTLQPRLKRWLEYLNAPIDPATLVLFRVAYGTIAFVHLQTFFGRTGIYRYFNKPDLLFPWVPFSWMAGWLQPLPPAGMYLLYGLALASTLGIMLGYHYRLSSLLFVVIYGYMHLLDIAMFFHHHFLILFLGIILCLVPAHCQCSVDSIRTSNTKTTRRWHGWLLRFQIGLVYFFAGVAKINPDWMYRGEPLKIHLNYFFGPLEGPLMTFVQNSVLTTATVVTIANAILVLELLAVPGLLWKPSRKATILLLVVFHAVNHALFPIGVFPALAVTGTLMFLPWSLPRRAGLFSEHNHPRKKKGTDSRLSTETVSGTLLLLFLVGYVAFQVIMPLRQYWLPGDRMWSRSGFRLSWGMVSTRRESFMQVTARIGDEIKKIDPRDHLNNRQIGFVRITPDALLRYANFIGQRYNASAVYAYDAISLNGRPPALFVDPSLNLLTIDRDKPVVQWIEPFPRWKPSPLPSPPMKPNLPRDHPLWNFFGEPLGPDTS